MFARRSPTELRLALCAVSLICACRSDDPKIVIPIADGAVVAPNPDLTAFVPRLKTLGIPRLLIPYIDGETDVAALAAAASDAGIELTVGLSAARPVEDEWNGPPNMVSPALREALDRLGGAGAGLSGVHLDHMEPGSRDPGWVDYVEAVSKLVKQSLPNATLSYSIPARSLTEAQLMDAGIPPPAGTTLESLDSRPAAVVWADSWRALTGLVDHVLVQVGPAPRDIESVAEDIVLLKEALGTVRVSVALDATAGLGSADSISRFPLARARDVLMQDISVLRARADAVFISGGESFEPDRFLAPDQSTRDPAPDRFDPDLEARAIQVERALSRCCLRDGQLVTVYDHRYEREHGPNRWQEDACWLTGLYTSAASFRYAVTGDEEALENARMGFEALYQMATVTPLKGEVVRNFVRTLYTQANPVEAGSDTIKRWRRAKDKEIYWVGDISVDQLSAWFNGIAVYHELVADEDERLEIADIVKAVLDIFLDNDLRAIEHTGEPTTFGDLRGQPLLALSFFQTGYRITKDERYLAELNRLLDEEAMHIQAANTLSLYHSFERYGSDHFYSSGFYPLIAFETDPVRRARLEAAFLHFSGKKRHHGDAYADMVFGVFHRGFDTARRSALELSQYRAELVENAAWMRDVGTYHEGPFIPIAVRPAGELDFDYVPPGPKGLRGGLEHRFNGVGFLLAYWMGRYHGIL